ncbi:MAG: D-2-hydroxyacid dehydrogenase [Lachnospiraceae bacterium]|nr:D-2-hydroxyacid dehydrogenase [Lachnospiraceae bacterium]
MIKVLVVMQILEEHKELLRGIDSDLDISFIPAAQVKPQDVEDVEIIVGNVNPALLSNCKNLKLLQLNSAGTDGYTAAGVLPEGAVLTNATGAYGLAISEHMLGALLCLMKKLDLYRLNQEEHVWRDEGPVTSIYGSKTLIVGFGDIGNEFGTRMNALGSEITAIRKNVANKPDYVDSIHTVDDLHDCLSKADIIAACLPGTAETNKLFDREAFNRVKPGAYFINIGRGTAVDTDALCDALESGILAGAAVDVTDPEPLPKDHRLWSIPNVLITPHASGGYHLKETHDRIIGIAARNINHLLHNEPFENIVDMKTGYRKNN